MSAVEWIEVLTTAAHPILLVARNPVFGRLKKIQEISVVVVARAKSLSRRGHANGSASSVGVALSHQVAAVHHHAATGAVRSPLQHSLRGVRRACLDMF